jgi:protein involved in polysaccharide export with SLBB domain
MGAIRVAGGFAAYADKKNVQITRADGTVLYVHCLEAIKHPEKDPPIYAGDRIWVGRRF